MTQNLYENYNNIGNNSFKLIDTPGTDSKVDVFKHAILLKTDLTTQEINTIFVILKYDNRCERIEEDYIKILHPILKYSHKVVIILSFWDMSDNQEEDFKQIYEIMGPHNKSIICYSILRNLFEISNITV